MIKRKAPRRMPARDFAFHIAPQYKGDECLIWPHKRSPSGYGRLRDPSDRSKWMVASRVVCEIVHGPPPTPKHECAHSCGNGHLGCVTPRHLSWKTRTENERDKNIHGTHNKGEKNGQCRLKESEVLEILSLKGTAPQRIIAEKFHVSESSIARIIAGTYWKHLQHESRHAD